MKHCFIFVFSIIISFVASLQAEQVFFNITFSSPEHTVGFPPATNPPTGPTRIVFGEPVVLDSLGSLNHQPLVFNTEGNSPTFYYDQIKLGTPGYENFYYVSFDLLIQNLIDSTNQFTVLFDTPTVRNIIFRNDGDIFLLNPGDSCVIGSFSEDTVMRFEVYLYMNDRQWTIIVNDNIMHSGDFNFEEYLRSIRFSMGLRAAYTTPNHNTFVGLDNIIVANYVVPRNAPPIAHAGEDQFVYAWIDGIAEVELDGSGSYDEDGDELSYLWTWEVEGEIFDANGVNPVIELPAGEYVITLIVNDGIIDSDPNEVSISVIEPLEVEVEVRPETINRQSSLKNINAVMVLPGDVGVEDVSEEALLLCPGEIEAILQEVVLDNKGVVNVSGSFDKAALMEAAQEDGETEVTVVGRFTSGRWFFGSDIVKILDSARYRWEIHTGAE